MMFFDEILNTESIEVEYHQGAAAYQKRCEKKLPPDDWKPFRRSDDSEIRSLEELFDYSAERPGMKGMTLERVLMVGFTAYRVPLGGALFRFVNDLEAPIGETQTKPTTTPAPPTGGPEDREFS